MIVLRVPKWGSNPLSHPVFSIPRKCCSWIDDAGAGRASAVKGGSGSLAALSVVWLLPRGWRALMASTIMNGV